MPPARIPACMLLAVLGCTSLAAAPAPSAAAPASAPDPANDAPKLAVARNGADVLLNWQIPATLDIKLIELIRNTQRDAKGRTRVASVHARPGLYTDKVPDPSADYWYWLKITLKSGQVVGVGPVQAPPSVVWQPET